MTQVRCLRCGAFTDDRAPGYPSCPVCEEDLAACPYCSHFDQENEDCLHPLASQLFPPRKGQRLCPQHHSRLLATRGELSLHPALRLLLLGGGLFALLLVASVAVSPPPEVAPALQLAVVTPYREAVAGRPLLIWIEIHNRSQEASLPISLRLPTAFLEGFAWSPEQFRPRPRRVEERGEEWRLSFPRVRGQEQLLVRLKLTPRQPGMRELTVKLFAGEREFQGQVKAPLRVLPVLPLRQAGHKTGSAQQVAAAGR